MPTKKAKKKVIDNVIRDAEKKSSKKTKNSKKTSNAKPSKEAVNISAEETTITVIEADDIDSTDKSNSSDITAQDPTADQPISEPEIAEEAVEIEVREEKAEAEKTQKIEVTTPEDESLVVESVMEETAIDDNLDKLIEDIEKDEQAQKSKAEKSKKDEPKADKKTQDKKEGKTKKHVQATADKKPEQKLKKRKKLPMRALPFRILSAILALGTIGAVASAVVRITLTGIVPNKYLIPAIAGLALILLFYLFKTLRRKTHIPVLIILNLFGIALSVVSIFGFVKVQETMSFLFNNFNESKEYTVYDIIVNKDSTYNTLDDVKGKTFHSISNFVDTEKLETAARDQADASISYENGIYNLLNNADRDKTYIAVLNSGTWEATLGLNDGKNDYVNKFKVIGELKVEEEKKNDLVESNLTTESFTVFVSGIDTRTGLMLDKSLSDVNIVITVNPKTKNILMTTIPRDYYVQLHGTTGLRDKLTHAGALGGLPLSMATIEDLLDFKFSRYIRVNFNFVVNLVDAIGGITIDSDVDYNITAYTNHACVFYPGANQVNGKCALAFARERYAYSDGDRHRGRNQEQVIEKVFQKLTSSNTLISRYSDILSSLSGSFDTNISASDITSLANMQLDDMAKWTVETYNLDGPTGMTYTYSYPNQLLSVMYPDETTVETARAKIKQVLTGPIEATETDTTETIIEE